MFQLEIDQNIFGAQTKAHAVYKYHRLKKMADHVFSSVASRSSQKPTSLHRTLHWLHLAVPNLFHGIANFHQEEDSPDAAQALEFAEKGFQFLYSESIHPMILHR